MNEQIISNEVVNEICNYLIKKLALSHKSKTFDVSSVFRILNKGKMFSKFYKNLSGKEELIELEINKEELSEFILNINPYSNSIKNKDKYEFYLRAFYLSKVVFNSIEKTINTRNIVSFYKIRDITNKKHVSYCDLFYCQTEEDAKLPDKEKVMESIKIYAAAYIALNVPLELQIEGYNSLLEMIEIFYESYNISNQAL